MFLQTVCAFCCCLYSSPRFWSCVPLCCATSAVVCVTFAPPVRLYLVFLHASWCVCVVFLEVAVYFLLLLLLLRCCGSVLSWCFWVDGVLSWFRGVLGVCACLLLVWLLVGVGVWLVCFFCLWWFCFVLLWSAFWWVWFSVRCSPGGVVLCSWLCWCVRVWLFFARWLVSGGSCVAPPLLTQNATLVRWLCGVSAPGGYASGWLCAIQLVRLIRASYIGSVLFIPSVVRVSCRKCPSPFVAVASRLFFPSGCWFMFSAAVHSSPPGVVRASSRCACACSFSLFMLLLGYVLNVARGSPPCLIVSYPFLLVFVLFFVIVR